MPTPAEQISIARANALLNVARALRRTVTFSHRSGGTNTLYVLLDQDWTESKFVGSGIIEDVRMLRLQVSANQAGLIAPSSTDSTSGAGEPIIVGDKVVYSKYPTRVYAVVGQILKDAGAHIYTVTCQQTKRLGNAV